MKKSIQNISGIILLLSFLPLFVLAANMKDISVLGCAEIIALCGVALIYISNKSK